MDELKPCPFCGKTDALDDADQTVFTHDSEDCPLHDGCYEAEEWNRRTPPPPAAQAIAELEQRLDLVDGSDAHAWAAQDYRAVARDAIALCKQLAAAPGRDKESK